VQSFYQACAGIVQQVMDQFADLSAGAIGSSTTTVTPKPNASSR